MIVKKGIGANIGIAIGKAYLLKEESVVIEKTIIPKEKIKHELKRYRDALLKTKEDLNLIKEQILNSLGKTHAKLIDAHHMILQDPLINKDVPQFIYSNGVNAEFALSEKINETLKKFESIKDPFFLERKNEILDVAKRLMSNLSNENKLEIKDLKEPSILIAHNIYPSDTLQIRKSDKVIAFCMDVGSKSSHTAIFAQSIGIPAIVGLGDISRMVKNGTLLIVNGEEGTVTIDPTPDMVELAKLKMEEMKKKDSYLLKAKNLPTVTRDAKKINLMVNLDPEDDVNEFKKHNTDGIGLFRTEFLYMNRTNIPNEREQYEVYKRILDISNNLPVTIRTADIGADKATEIGIKGIKNEENPFMGFRGIRLFLKYPELLKTQLKAIFMASPNTNVQIMIPMVTSVSELFNVKKVINEVKNELTEADVEFKKEIPLGIMVEVPAAAIMLDQLLDEIDFVSVGTNDLVQYLLAVDRVNPYVSDLYDPYHPSVIRILNLIIQTVHKKGKKVSICGEMASDIYGALILIALGADSLSVPLKMHLKVKECIRNSNYDKLVLLRQKILNAGNSKEILDLFNFN